MSTVIYKTRSVKTDEIIREWILVDAQNEVVGRLASNVAVLLMGKHKTYYTPNLNCGDNVIIINAEKLVFTGNKMEDKEYVRHSGYPGGQRRRTPKQQMIKDPTRIIEKAVKGMLPKTRLGAEMFRHLFVYSGTDHKHEAQKPKTIDIKSIR